MLLVLNKSEFLGSKDLFLQIHEFSENFKIIFNFHVEHLRNYIYILDFLAIFNCQSCQETAVATCALVFIILLVPS